MRAAVIAIVERQHGVISRVQLLALGVPRTDRKRGLPSVRRFARVIGLPQYRSKFEREFHRWLRTVASRSPRAAAEAARHGYRVLRVPAEGFASRRQHIERRIRAALLDDWNGQAVLR